MSTDTLVVEDVSIDLGGRPVLREVGFSVAAGEVVALIGPSGSGKSTVLRVLLGLERPSRGRVTIAGKVVTEGSRLHVPAEARGLSMVFQDLALWPHLSVRGHLRFVLDCQRVPRADHPRRIDAPLARLGLQDKAERQPGELSGGERQRVAIARALVIEPTALLLDEPLANVDIVLKAEMLALFAELLAERHTAGIYVTHDPREATRLARRVVVLEGGAVVQQGTIDQLRAAPASGFVSKMLVALA